MPDIESIEVDRDGVEHIAYLEQRPLSAHRFRSVVPMNSVVIDSLTDLQSRIEHEITTAAEDVLINGDRNREAIFVGGPANGRVQPLQGMPTRVLWNVPPRVSYTAAAVHDAVSIDSMPMDTVAYVIAGTNAQGQRVMMLEERADRLRALRRQADGYRNESQQTTIEAQAAEQQGQLLREMARDLMRDANAAEEEAQTLMQPDSVEQRLNTYGLPWRVALDESIDPGTMVHVAEDGTRTVGRFDPAALLAQAALPALSHDEYRRLLGLGLTDSGVDASVPETSPPPTQETT